LQIYFFAKSESGSIPRFATMDSGIYNKMLGISGVNPAKLGKEVFLVYPNGFTVTIEGQSIIVVPLPKR
jgi:hypothetical protein